MSDLPSESGASHATVTDVALATSADALAGRCGAAIAGITWPRREAKSTKSSGAASAATPQPMWLHAATRKNMGSASETDAVTTVEYVALPTTGCATPLAVSVAYSGSCTPVAVVESANGGASPRNVSSVTVMFSPVHVKLFTPGRSLVTVTAPSTPMSSSASSSEPPIELALDESGTPYATRPETTPMNSTRM